jgi:hypothetical protein
MGFLLSRNAFLVTLWLSVAASPFDEPGELRFGEGQQRADRFGLDVEHSCHRVRFDPFVTQT